MNDDYSEQDLKEPLIKIKQVKLERDSLDRSSRESFEKIQHTMIKRNVVVPKIEGHRPSLESVMQDYSPLESTLTK